MMRGLDSYSSRVVQRQRVALRISVNRRSRLLRLRESSRSRKMVYLRRHARIPRLMGLDHAAVMSFAK